MTSTQPSRRGIRWGLATALALLALISLARWLGPGLVVGAARRSVAEAGWELERLDVDRLGVTGLTLSHIVLGPIPRVQIQRLRLEWGLADLLRLRASRAEISGIEVALAGSPEHSANAGPAPTDAPPTLRPRLRDRLAQGITALGQILRRLRRLPIDEVEFDLRRAALPSPMGEWSATVSGTMQRTQDGVGTQIDAFCRFAHRRGELGGPARFLVEGDQLLAELELQPAEPGQKLSLRAELQREGSALRGQLAAEFDQLDVPGGPSDLDGAVRLSLEGGPDRWDVRPEGPIELRWSELSAELLTELEFDETLRRAAARPGHLTVSSPPGAESLASLTTPTAGPPELAIDASLRIENERHARVQLDGRLRATLDPADDAVSHLELDAVALRVLGWPLDIARTSEARVELSLRGPPGALRGSVGFDARLDGVEGDRGKAESLEMSLVAEAWLEEGVARLILDHCGEVVARAPQLAGWGGADDATISVCGVGRGVASLTLASDERSGSGIRGSADLILTSGPIEGTAERESGDALGFRAMAPALRIRAEGSALDRHRGEITTEGGVLEIAEFSLRASGATTELSWTVEGEATQAEGRSEIGHLERSDLAPPLVAIAELELAEGHLELRARLRDQDSRLVVDTVVKHALQSREGSVRFELVDLAFEPGELQPADLFYPLAGLAADATGAVSAGGEASWAEDEWTSQLDLGFEFSSLVVDGFPVEGFGGEVHFDSLVPLSTPPGQPFDIAFVNAGIALTEWQGSFAIQSDDGVARLEIESLRWSGMDGSFDLTGELVLGQGERDGSLRLRLTDAALSSLLTQLEIDGLAGEGLLGGEIPIRYDDTGLHLDGGELATRGAGGWVRYTPSVAPETLGAAGAATGGMGTLLAALENFHYRSMRVTADGDLAGDVVVGVHLAGANPDLYDGIPFEVNIPVTLPLQSLLRSKAATYHSRESLREFLREQP